MSERKHQRHASVDARQREHQEDTPLQSRIRHGPWSFADDFKFQSRHRLSAFAQFQLQISGAAESGKIIDCFHACHMMKEQGIMPDLFIYNDLLKVAAKDGFHMVAEGVMDDMISLGIQPDRQSYHHLIYVQCFSAYCHKCMNTKVEYLNSQNEPWTLLKCGVFSSECESTISTRMR
jgi:pentatricopeptide repeat protein